MFGLESLSKFTVSSLYRRGIWLPSSHLRVWGAQWSVTVLNLIPPVLQAVNHQNWSRTGRNHFRDFWCDQEMRRWLSPSMPGIPKFISTYINSLAELCPLFSHIFSQTSTALLSHRILAPQVLPPWQFGPGRSFQQVPVRRRVLDI